MVQYTLAVPVENAKEPRMAVAAERTSRDDPNQITLQSPHGIARKVKGRSHGTL